MIADPPRCTVVMMTYNRREEACRTLSHLASLPDRAPVIVVDNGSTDGTADAIARQHPHVRLVRCRRNMGAVARNIAVEKVTTPYVAFCDDDTRWQPGALTRAARLLDEQPGVAAVTGRILVEPTLVEDPLVDELRHSPVPRPPGQPYPAVLGFMAGMTMLRVEPFRAVGGFSPRLWFNGEEELVAIDLASAGWSLCFAEDVVIHHAPSTIRDPRQRRRLGIRNTLWTAWLRRPARSALRHTITVLRDAPKDRTTLAAVAEAMAGAGWIWRERRVAPPHVESALRLLDDARRQ